MRIKFLLLPLIILVILGVVLVPRVQAISPSSIRINMTPDNPAPHENVNITLTSFTVNLDSIKITWLIDGKIVSSDIGKKSLSTTAKATNIGTQIKARIFLPDGEIEKTVFIRPSKMVLLWQANDSYVPPFYKGKALPSVGSEIKVVAIPEIKIGNTEVNSSNMTYDWKLNYNNMPSASGYARSSLSFTQDYLEDSSNISVIVSTIDQQNSSEANIKITSYDPEIYFYKKDATLGTLWGHSLFNNYIIKEEETIIAEPYFISPKNWHRPEFMFYWSINNRSVAVPSFTKNTLPIKPTEGASGTAKLRLEIENTDKIFQTASREINLQF